MKEQKQLVSNFTLGLDVEFLLKDKETGEIISAEGLVKGTKDDPFRFDSKNPYYATSLDNVMAEGNIPPVKSPYQLFKAVQKLRDYIQSTMPENIEVLSIPSAKLEPKWLQTEHAQLAGCDVSFNAYTREPITATVSPEGYRGASYHIHIGYEEPSLDTNYMLGRAMDLFLGVPAVLLEPKNDRKKAGYGFAGNVRHQRHGLEYRTLSSYFSSNRKLIQWTYNNTKKAIDLVNEGNMQEVDNMGEMIETCINNENENVANFLIERFKIPLVK